MQYLLNTWYFAAWAESVKQGQTFARTIINRPIVFFRKADGKVVAMDDRCPHRAAPLSRGKLQGDRIVCGYHGLEFDGAGACVRNPHPSGKIPAAAKVRTYPVEERHTGLWIWFGDKPADASLIPDFKNLDDPQVMRRDHIMMDVPYDLIVDNLLDCSHICFLHDGILGNEPMIAAPTEIAQRGNTINVTRYARAVPPPKFFDLIFREDGEPVDCWTDFRWDAPSCLLLYNGVTLPGRPMEEGAGIFGTHILTPETDKTTHYFTAGTRWNVRPETDTPEMREKLADMRLLAFEEQDEPMIKAQARIIEMTPPSELERVMLETDLGIVRWRRIMGYLMAAEGKGAAIAGQTR